MIARKNRFHGHHAVSRVRGPAVHSKSLSARIQRSNRQDSRLAIVVSKKVAARAVKRNRIRRRLYEIVRTEGLLGAGVIDVVIYVKTDGVSAADYESLKSEVRSLFAKNTG